jgi:AbrB family looped-hinge helix DNA binding protein
MKTTISIDRSGRMVLPKEVRTKLHLGVGDLLEMELGAGEIRLRPLHASHCRMIREGGRAVWDAPGATASVDEIERALTRGREERDARAGGL